MNKDIFVFIDMLNEIYYKDKDQRIIYKETRDNIRDVYFISIELKSKTNKNRQNDIVLRVRSNNREKAADEFRNLFFSRKFLDLLDWYMNNGSDKGIIFKNLDTQK